MAPTCYNKITRSGPKCLAGDFFFVFSQYFKSRMFEFENLNVFGFYAVLFRLPHPWGEFVDMGSFFCFFVARRQEA